MASKHKDIVDAVVAALDAATLSQSFTPRTELIPFMERDEITSWDVSVFAGPQNREMVARAKWFVTFTVGVVIRFPGTDDETTLEARAGQMIQLTEEIISTLQSSPQMASGWLFEIDQESPFDPGKLNEGLFLSQVMFRYKEV